MSAPGLPIELAPMQVGGNPEAAIEEEKLTKEIGDLDITDGDSSSSKAAGPEPASHDDVDSVMRFAGQSGPATALEPLIPKAKLIPKDNKQRPRRMRPHPIVQSNVDTSKGAPIVTQLSPIFVKTFSEPVQECVTQHKYPEVDELVKQIIQLERDKATLEGKCAALMERCDLAEANNAYLVHKTAVLNRSLEKMEQEDSYLRGRLEEVVKSIQGNFMLVR